MKLFTSSEKKKLFMLLSMLVIAGVSAFAEDTFGLESKMEVIINLLNSPWVKGIAFVALVVECIAMITAGRQEPGMFKKFIPWIAGTVLFMAAGKITKAFMKVGTENSDNSATELFK